MDKVPSFRLSFSKLRCASLPGVIGALGLCAAITTAASLPSSGRANSPVSAVGQTSAGNGSKSTSPVDSFLNLVIKVHEKSAPEVMKATQVPGKVILRQDAASNYLYEITKDGKTFVVAFLPEDPFVTRAFRDAEHQHEQAGKTSSPTIILNVPQTDLRAAQSGTVGIRLYKVNAGVGLDSISPSAFEDLKSQHQLTLMLDISGRELSNGISSRNND